MFAQALATIDATSGQLVSSNDHQAVVCMDSSNCVFVNLIETFAFSLQTLTTILSHNAKSTTNGDILIALIVARTNLHTSTLHFLSLTAASTVTGAAQT